VVTTWYNDIWQTLITKVCVLSERSQPWLQVWRHNSTACVSGWKIDRTVRRVCACWGLHSEVSEMLKFHPLSHNECAFREVGTDMKKVYILFTYKCYLIWICLFHSINKLQIYRGKQKSTKGLAAGSGWGQWLVCVNMAMKHEILSSAKIEVAPILFGNRYSKRGNSC